MAHEFPCPLCRERLPVRMTKKQKPVLTCDSCGVQLFVRYSKGIERLEKLTESRASFLAGFVVCEGCQIAVRITKKKIQRPLWGKDGIYCPECEKLLLAAKEVPQ